MNISNDSSGGSVNYVDYFTKQFLKDLAKMAALRDELEARQGAMTAVDDANQLRKDAVIVRTQAETDAAAMKEAATQFLADAKAKNEAVNAKVVELNAREKALDDAKAAFEKASAADEKSLADRLKAILIRENGISAREEALTKMEADLRAQQDSLEARIKAFQAKVAALSA